MSDVQHVINSIKKNDVTEEDLIHYLDSSNILIKANAIFQIVRLKFHDDITIEKLVCLAKKLDEEPKVIGSYNNALFALAALSWLETEQSLDRFEEIVKSIEPEKRILLSKLIEEKPYLYL
ncbi:hypothetical protein BP422_24195 [Brevibacillus formosus]|uniref:Uncharacterized protein n=1 Tax=Brevibacillus formosus TaxID=54913 RepID=A0A220MMM9_9BACL|nr:hypothetical protein [Brevibacillus formosus]ASJ56394.1 hypothetical protein BP422_24195 [Brevibacillus formosus]